MKQKAIVLLISTVFLVLAGIALAGEISGVITAVDAEKGMFALKDGTRFDGVAASLLNGFKAGDQAKVEYKEEGGKKIVTKITKPPIGC